MKDQSSTTKCAAALLAWVDAGHLRDLPWRAEPRDPYGVWVSEIMLQQTQTATATPYLQRWLERFPTVETLAVASLDEVLKLWEGLGYYSRARNLHKAARIVVDQHQGRLPAERRALLALPGIGRYTAGAILSIAFGQRAAVLDGNVKRVLARVYDVAGEIGKSATETELWRLAEALVERVEPQQAGPLNEALMDLGATICLPQRPRCLLCPLHDFCLARQRGTQEERPVRPARKPLPHLDVTAAVLRRPGHPEQFLIAQRPPEGMLGGLWEFPGGKRHAGESLAECLQREMQEELGVEVAVGRLVTSVKHAYTHFRITLHAFECQWLAGEPQPIGVADWRWVTMDDLASYAFAVTDQKIILALAACLSS
ncbi:MAG: A/G-specific adenine glycosylase [Anaerolinea sp.]|nr:A/G-specific adenine glycosylase [Anaerolinea sp.]